MALYCIGDIQGCDAALDRLLEPYGAFGATGRDKQLSSKIVSDELDQLKVMGTVLPAIFLAVAMFILNVVISRQVATQRSQIAALKALGYGDGAIAWHYIQLALVIAGLGVVVGLGLSQLIGRGMLSLYDEVFRFNRLAYATDTTLVLLSAAIAGLAAAAGIAWINAVGNLGGHFGPDIIGRIRTATGSADTALLALAFAFIPCAHAVKPGDRMPAVPPMPAKVGSSTTRDSRADAAAHRFHPPSHARRPRAPLAAPAGGAARAALPADRRCLAGGGGGRVAGPRRPTGLVFAGAIHVQQFDLKPVPRRQSTLRLD